MAAVAVSTGLAPVQVKQEKPDDPEIVEMAAKIAEANRAKLAAANATAAAQPRLNGAGNLRGYIMAAGTPGAAGQLKPVLAPAPVPEVEMAIDEPSSRGKFSWTVVGTSSVPVILRRDGKYISVRIMEAKVLNTHLNFLHPDIYLQARVPSYAMTEAEHRLLNEINLRHCESKFGRETFSSKDLVVKVKDAIDFFYFLDVCYHKLQNGSTTSFGSNKCGFIRINKDSVIPYTVKDGERYVPIFYFEGETDKLKTKSVELSGWELAYLKFCCKVQGIKNELFNNETCAVTSLNDIKSYFSAGDVFEEYWPNKVVDSQLLISQTKHAVTGSNSWIRTPPPGPNTHKTATVRNGVIAVNGDRAAWASQAARGPVAAAAVSVQQQMAAAQRAASMRGAVPQGASRMPQAQYFTNPANNALLVRQQGAPTHPPSGANVTSAYAKVISNSYTNLTPSGAYKSSWPNGYTPANVAQLHQMITSGHLTAAASYPSYQTGAAPAGTTTKTAPPPLIPVVSQNQRAAAAAQRYPGLTTAQQQVLSKQAAANAEIIDLSSPPNSPQRSATSRNSSQMNQRILPAPSSPLSTMYMKYESAIVDSFQYIPEVIGSTASIGNSRPFKLSKVRIQGATLLTCINRQPFLYNEDLMTTITDFISVMCPSIPPTRVVKAFTVLSIKMYIANKSQVQTLMETKKYKDLLMINPLISIVDIKEHMGAVHYVLNNENSSTTGSAAKRSRMS